MGSLGGIGQVITLNELVVLAMFLSVIWMLFRGIPVAFALMGVKQIKALFDEL